MEIELVPISENSRIDLLSKFTTVNFKKLTGVVCFKVLKQPSINAQESMVVDVVESWMDLIVKYIKERKLPNNLVEAQKRAQLNELLGSRRMGLIIQ